MTRQVVEALSLPSVFLIMRHGIAGGEFSDTIVWTRPGGSMFGGSLVWAFS